MNADDNNSPDGITEGRDFLSRWSRRKVDANKSSSDDEGQQFEETQTEFTSDEPAALSANELEALSDEELLDHFDLPDPDTLKQGDDFTAFMKGSVPTRLRNRALRKLWLSNPTLANVDMLLDYGDDFTDAATVVPGMMTAYEVGKGIARRFEELTSDKASEIEEPALDEEESASDTTIGEADLTNDDSSQMDDPQTISGVSVEMIDDEDGANEAITPESNTFVYDEETLVEMQPARRMQFSFDD